MLHHTRSKVSELASGMRQLAGTKTRYRRAHAAPLAGHISGRAKYNVIDFDFAGSSHGWVEFCRSPWQTDMAQYSERKLTEVRFIDK